MSFSAIFRLTHKRLAQRILLARLFAVLVSAFEIVSLIYISWSRITQATRQCNGAAGVA